MDGLKKLCLLTNIVLTLFAAMICVIGAMMGQGWCREFFGSIPGQVLLISLGLLLVVLVLEFGSAGRMFYASLMWFRWNRKDFSVSILLFAVVVFIFYSRIVPVKSHNLKSIYFVPHIFACLLSYIFFLQGAYFAGKYLLHKKAEDEDEAYRLSCLGFPLLTAGIVIGSVWAASAWGSWWSWDPKETFSLAVWFVYFAFIIFRKFYGRKFLLSNCLWNIAAFVMIIIGVTVVNFSKIFAGLHSY